MSRALSKVAPEWWDYTTLDGEILHDAAKLTPEDMQAMSREGFEVVFHAQIKRRILRIALAVDGFLKKVPGKNGHSPSPSPV